MATPGALLVTNWHLVAFRRFWRAMLMSSFVQPMLYLLGLGVGVGSLVDSNVGSSDVLGSLSYVEFVAPGLLVTTAMMLGAQESMWPVLGGLTWQRGYHGIAATSLEARDIVLGHQTWMAIRCGVAALTVALALAFFNDTRSWGLIPGVLIAVLVGLAFSAPVMAFAIGAKYDGAFAGVQRFVIIPLFLFGGAFYPLTQLPTAIQWIAKIFPLWHGVTVARDFSTGSVDWSDVAGHVGYLVLWFVVGVWVATLRLRKRLYP